MSSRNGPPGAARPEGDNTLRKEVLIRNDGDEPNLAHALDAIDRARTNVEVAMRDTRRDPPDRKRKRAVIQLATALNALERAQDALARR